MSLNQTSNNYKNFNYKMHDTQKCAKSYNEELLGKNNKINIRQTKAENRTNCNSREELLMEHLLPFFV